MRVTAEAIELIARQYVNAAFIGIGHNRPINERQFKAFFKLCPLGVARLWYALEETCHDCIYCDGVGPVLNFTSTRPEHLLLCLNYMKTYSGVSVGASLFHVSEKTHRRYFWAMVSYLGHLANCTVSNMYYVKCLCKMYAGFLHCVLSLYHLIQVLMSNRLMNNNGSECLLTVDGTDFQINEPTPFSPVWYSHKFQGPALRYEFGVCIQTGWLCWIAGPFPAGDFPDMEIFTLGLMHELQEGEKVEVDEGYTGDIPIRPKSDFGGKDEWKYMKGKARARHECINRMFKQWGILGQKFRHSRHKHGDVLLAVSAIVQNEIKDGRGTFQVEYEIKRDSMNSNDA